MNVKKQFRVSGFIRKTTALHVHQTLWYISLTSTHDYGVILPNATFLFYRRELTFAAFAAYRMFFQAIRQLETEIETTRKATIANAGTQGSLEKRLLDYRGNLILKTLLAPIFTYKFSRLISRDLF